MSKQRQERDASVAFIGAARNAKIASEAAISESETNAIARELEGAHEEALAIKHARAQQGAAPIAPVQAFPHGPIMPGSGGGGDAHNGGDALRSSQIQAAQKDLYSSGKEAAGGAAEAVKEAVASVDQSTTEAVRHGSAAATSAIGGMVERASQAVRHAEEAVKGMLPGGVGAYEGAVFGGDDPEYTAQRGGASGDKPAAGAGQEDVPDPQAPLPDAIGRVAVQLGGGGEPESVAAGLEAQQPSLEPAGGGAQAAEHAAAGADAPAGADAVTDMGEGVLTPESIVSVVSATGQPLLSSPCEPASPAAAAAAAGSHTPAYTLDELAQGKGLGSVSAAASSDDARPRQPAIATPKEPGSLGEGSVGVAAGEPRGGANVVAAADTAGRGLLEMASDVLGLSGRGVSAAPVGAPPQPPSDPDPRTRDVPVGNFKALKEALAQPAAQAPASSADAPASSADMPASSAAADAAASAQDSLADAAASAKQQAADTASAARERLAAADNAAADAASGGSTGTAAVGGGGTSGGGGLLSSLAGVVASIASKANISNSSEELLAGGVVPDDAPGSAAAGGDTAAAPAPAAAGVAAAASDAAASAKQQAGDAASAARERVESAGDVVSDAAASAKHRASDAAASTKDVMAGGADSARDAAASASDRASDAAASTKQQAGDAAASAQQQAADTASAARERLASAGEQVHQRAEAAGDAVEQGAHHVQESSKHAAAVMADAMQVEGMGVTDAASGGGGTSGGTAAEQAARAALAAQEAAYAAAAGPQHQRETAAVDDGVGSLTAALHVHDSGQQQQRLAAMSVYDTAAGTAAEQQQAQQQQQPAVPVSGSGSKSAPVAASGSPRASLIEDAKEGFVGAFDTAAAALGSVKDAVASRLPHPQQQQQQQQDVQPAADAVPTPAAAAVPEQLQQKAEQAAMPAHERQAAHEAAANAVFSGGQAAGSTSTSGSSGLLSTLKQGWDELKHGGAKAPHATSIAGEASAPHDVTSNVERSRHLDDPAAAKVYDAETYKVAPGAQAASDQASTDAAKQQGHAGVVAGDKRPVTGTTPHGEPDSSKVHADQGTRFQGDRGIGSSIGTGSAAPWSGDDSIKRTAALFAGGRTGGGGGGGVPQGAESQPADANGGTGEASVGSWLCGMAAAWGGVGRGAAKGPTGKDVPQEATEKQDVMVDPVGGVTPVHPPQGADPAAGHKGGKKMMRPPEMGYPPKHDTEPKISSIGEKASRLGKIVTDSPSDPGSLKGTSCDSKPDGVEHLLKDEAAAAGSSLAQAPQALASALATAAEMVAGATSHVGASVSRTAHNLAQGDVMSQQERDAKTRAGVDRIQDAAAAVGATPPPEAGGSVTGRAASDIQEDRLAAIGDPAFKRETLGDKVLGPLVSDARDATHAKELAASYKDYKAEHEGGTGSSVGGSSSSDEQTQPPRAAASKTGKAVRDSAQQAADTARSAADVVGMQSRSAAQSAADSARGAAERVSESVRGAAQSAAGMAGEARDTAASAGEVVQMEVQEGAQGAKEGLQRAADATRDTAQQGVDAAADGAGRVAGKTEAAAERAKQGAQDAADATRDTAQQGVDTAAEGAGRLAGRTEAAAEQGADTLARAGESAGEAVGGVLSAVGGAAKSLLGALLGPFERQGAFDETTAAVTGAPEDFEVVGVEQLTGREAGAIEATRAAPEAAGDTGTVGAAAKSPEPAAAGGEARSGRQPGAAAPPAGNEAQQAADNVQEKLQSGVDDGARAAGLAAGHVSSGLATLAESLHAPTPDIPTNTEDLPAAR